VATEPRERGAAPKAPTRIVDRINQQTWAARVLKTAVVHRRAPPAGAQCKHELLVIEFPSGLRARALKGREFWESIHGRDSMLGCRGVAFVHHRT